VKKNSLYLSCEDGLARANCDEVNTASKQMMYQTCQSYCS
jgi:hypothetical protein